jgi:hypothetical protein
VINNCTYGNGAMKRGSYMRGFLLGAVPVTVPTVTVDDVAGNATLWIEDVFGDRYPFAVDIDRSFSSEGGSFGQLSSE